MRRFRRDKNRERGSVLVELTMVVLPLMLIVMGMVEVGGAWRDKATIIQASRQGARVGVTASFATTDTVDREMLRSILANFPTGGSGNSGGSTITLHKVIIFDASNPATADANRDACLALGTSAADSIPPSGATSSGATAGRCNLYLAGNNGAANTTLANLLLTDINNPARFDGSNSAWDHSLPGSGRSNAAGSTDDIGVYIQAHRPWITGFFPGDGILISAETIMRIEPAT